MDGKQQMKRLKTISVFRNFYHQILSRSLMLQRNCNSWDDSYVYDVISHAPVDKNNKVSMALLQDFYIIDAL